MRSCRTQNLAAVAEIVGDVARPSASLPNTADLTHLPGESGWWCGIRTVLGLMRRGNAEYIDQIARFGPIYRTQLAHVPVVCVADPQLVAEIGRNDEGIWSSALAWRDLFDGVGDSTTVDALVTLDFAAHREARAMFQPAFSAPALQSYVAMAAPMFERAVDSWVQRGQVSFKAEVRRLFANVAGRVFMGIEDDAHAAMLDRALAAYWRAPFALVRNSLVSPGWRRARRGYRTLFDALRSLVGERRRGDRADLFSRLCREAGRVAWIDDDALVRLFISLLAGAFDTTSLAVASMGYLLATYPEWQHRLRAEATAVGTGRTTYDGARKLEALDWAWKETLRLYPVASDFPRRALCDLQLGPYPIPTGACVLALVAPLMHDPRWWSSPTSFDPERFSPARAEDRRQRGVFLPFGAGAHACIGAQFAGLEAKVFWHTMLTRCRFRLRREEPRTHVLRPLGCVAGDVRLIVEALPATARAVPTGRSPAP